MSVADSVPGGIGGGILEDIVASRSKFPPSPESEIVSQ